MTNFYSQLLALLIVISPSSLSNIFFWERLSSLRFFVSFKNGMRIDMAIKAYNDLSPISVLEPVEFIIQKTNIDNTAMFTMFKPLLLKSIIKFLNDKNISNKNRIRDTNPNSAKSSK